MRLLGTYERRFPLPEGLPMPHKRCKECSGAESVRTREPPPVPRKIRAQYAGAIYHVMSRGAGASRHPGRHGEGGPVSPHPFIQLTASSWNELSLVTADRAERRRHGAGRLAGLPCMGTPPHPVRLVPPVQPTPRPSIPTYPESARGSGCRLPPSARLHRPHSAFRIAHSAFPSPSEPPPSCPSSPFIALHRPSRAMAKSSCRNHILLR